MPSFPQAVSTVQKTVGSTTEKINENTRKISGYKNKQILELLYKMDAQLLNLFEIVIYPVQLKTTGANPGEQFKSVVQNAQNLVGDMTMTNIYAQKVTLNFAKYSHERADWFTFVKDVEYPESLMIDFIENQKGDIRRYLQAWLNGIAEFDDLKGYIFKDNQKAVERNAKIFLLNRQGVPTDIVLACYGIKLQGISSVDLEHSSNEPMKITADFSVNNTEWISLSGKVTGKVMNKISGSPSS